MRSLLTARFAFLVVVLLAVARSAAADTLTLMWDPNPDSAVTGYVVYVGTQSGVYTQTHDVGDTSWFVLQNAIPGQRYYLAVAAYAAGPLLGPRSAEVSGYSNAPPALVQPANQRSVVGVPVTLQLQGSDPYGEPVSFGASGLPPGLTLTPATGFIHGAGTTAGTYQVTVWVSDGVLQAQRSFTWTMSEASATPEPPPSSTEPPASDEPPATEPPPPAADSTAPVVAITVPSSAGSFASSLMTLTLAGTASDNVGVTSVSWVSSRGGSGVASGTTQWTIPGIPLQVGANVITVTARDAAGNQGATSVTVTYVDSEAPVVSLTSPGPVSAVRTNDEAIVLAGTASDNVGVTRVSWTTDSGFSGVAHGTTAWSLGPIALGPGTTRVFVSAEDAAGNRGSLLVTISRLVPSEPADTVVISPEGDVWEVSDPMGRTITGTTVITHPELEHGEAPGGEGDAWPQPPVVDSPSEPVSPGTVTLRMAMPREASGVMSTGTVTRYSRTPRTADVAPAGTTTAITPSTMPTTSMVLVDSAPLLQPVEAPGSAKTPVIDGERLGDRNAPKVTVTSPTDGDTYETTEARLFVVGVSVDDVGVTAVTWASSEGQAGTADGTSVWSFEVSLEPGENVITVMARDAAGNVGRAVLVVRRR
jgi:hypothetical protein